MRLEVHNSLVDQMHAILSPASMLTFPALENLRLTSDSLTLIWRLLRYFRTPEVHDLSVGVDTLPTASEIMLFFLSLKEICTHASLNNLSLVVYDDDDGRNEITLENASLYNITSDHLRPLTAFLNIKSILLDMPCGAHLNERDFLRLASSWPHMEKFEMGQEY